MSSFSFIDEILFTLTDQSAWDIYGVIQEQYNILSAQLGVDRADDKQALISNFKEMMLEAIGEDEEYTKDEADGKCEDMDTNIKSYMKGSRNYLRAEQRAVLESMLSKSKGNDNDS